MQELLDQAAAFIINSDLTIALTGAGISVESGIPDFRGAGGLWSKYDPAEYATIEAFRAAPQKVWEMLREMDAIVSRAEPNAGHRGMGELQAMGYLHCIITQNIDNLHQAGGARNVIEYHGNSSTLSCVSCAREYASANKGEEHPPRCECGTILKPNVVFFGEAIPIEAMQRSFQLASSANALLVVGTSAVVSPANTIPGIAKQNGARIIEVNKERTHLTDMVTDTFLQGEAGRVVADLVETVRRKSRKP